MSEDTDVAKYRSLLVAKAKKSGLFENFGQTEVRKLKDKYGYTKNVQLFDLWCMDFDQRELEKVIE